MTNKRFTYLVLLVPVILAVFFGHAFVDREHYDQREAMFRVYILCNTVCLAATGHSIQDYEYVRRGLTPPEAH